MESRAREELPWRCAGSRRAAQGGEFAFVLFAEALKLRVISPEVNANMTAIVVLSMAITPVTLLLYKRFARAQTVSMDGVEPAHNLQGNVLIIGFGRVGQIACQHRSLRERNFPLSK